MVTGSGYCTVLKFTRTMHHGLLHTEFMIKITNYAYTPFYYTLADDIYLTSNARLTDAFPPLTSTDKTRRLLLIGPTSGAARKVGFKCIVGELLTVLGKPTTIQQQWRTNHSSRSGFGLFIVSISLLWHAEERPGNTASCKVNLKNT